jgi:hypothetical protein
METQMVAEREVVDQTCGKRCICKMGEREKIII